MSEDPHHEAIANPAGELRPSHEAIDSDTAVGAPDSEEAEHRHSDHQSDGSVHHPPITDEGERLVPALHHDAVSYAEHIVRYLFASRLVEGQTVLDVASGVGYGSELMKAAGAKRVIALDYSAEATRYGLEVHASEGVEYITADAQELPLGNRAIDVVVSFETIEHLSNAERFLAEVRRTLRPDGLLVVSTPNRDVFIEGNPYHLHEFTYEELDTLLRQSFTNVKTYVQDDWISSAVLTPEDMERQDEQLVGALHTYKAISRPASQALFMLSICSEAEIPNPNEQTVMTGIYEMKGFVEELARRDEQIASLPELWAELEAKDRHIGDFQRMVAEKDGHLANMQAMIAERDRALEEMRDAVKRSEYEAQKVRSSLSYRLLAFPAAIRARLLGRESQK